jgi:hypothetical protein
MHPDADIRKSDSAADDVVIGEHTVWSRPFLATCGGLGQPALVSCASRRFCSICELESTSDSPIILVFLVAGAAQLLQEVGLLCFDPATAQLQRCERIWQRHQQLLDDTAPG